MADAVLEVGFSEAEITPKVGVPLSGFISRENRPSIGIASPIFVKVLVLRQAEVVAFLVSAEILGISKFLKERLLVSLERSVGPNFSRDRCTLLATHTHSAPPVAPLEGEVDPDPAYIDFLCAQTCVAAQKAVDDLSPAVMWYARAQLPGLTYNRRALLADGRVSMALEPDSPVLERGPVDDAFTLLVFRSLSGANRVALAHFACHGAAVCEQEIHGDIPGEISRRLRTLLAVPCIYLQGATGDINPLTISANRKTMLAWSDKFMQNVSDLPEKLQLLPSTPFRLLSAELPLVYQLPTERSSIIANIQGLSQIVSGDVDSTQVQKTLMLLSDLMNFKPGERPDPKKAAYAAQALMNAEKRTLAALDSGQPLPTEPLQVALWRLGNVGFAFVAAELFAGTGFRIRSTAPELALLPVTYAAPIVGYLPDSNAILKGGYEVKDAWRFYRKPAPFAPDSEDRLVDFIRTLVAGL